MQLICGGSQPRLFCMTSEDSLSWVSSCVFWKSLHEEEWVNDRLMNGTITTAGNLHFYGMVMENGVCATICNLCPTDMVLFYDFWC